MSVIITKIKMPKHCGDCEFMDNVGRCYNTYEDVYDCADVGLTYENCPLKSIDDLIKKIDTLNPVDYGSIASYEAHNGAREMKNDILKIIEKYFDVE